MSEVPMAETGSVRLVKAHEPRLDIRADREMVAMMGAANISTRGYVADTASAGQIIWSQTTPSVRVGVDRTIEAEVVFNVVFGNLPAGVTIKDPFNPQDFGLRQYPLHSIMENLQLRLNDQAFNWEPADTLHAMMRYGNDVGDRQYNAGSSAHKPDATWRYSEITGAPRSPFASWLASGEEDTRALNVWCSRVNANTLQVRMIEQLMISPLSWGENCQCLFGIQNIDVQMTFRNQLLRMFAGNLASPNLFVPAITEAQANALTLSFVPQRNDCLLHLTYLQPHADQVVPYRLNYPYYQIRRFQQRQDLLVSPLNTFNVNYDNITLHEIPKRMYIFAAPQVPESYTNTQLTAQANFFANIVRCRVNFDSQDGRLSTLSSFDLWKLSVRNGCQLSYLQWTEYVGSVLCLEFGKDLNLNPLLAPSVRGNFQLSLDVDFKDVRNVATSSNLTDEGQTEAKRYTAFLVIVPIGMVSIDNQLITTSIGSITEEQVLAAPWLPPGHRQVYRGMYGSGSFFGNIWQGIKKAARFAKPFIGPALGVGEAILSSMSDPRAQAIGKVIGPIRGAIGSGRRTGGRSTGGAKVRCNSLARRM
jgi:hypothetical protein